MYKRIKEPAVLYRKRIGQIGSQISKPEILNAIRWIKKVKDIYDTVELVLSVFIPIPKRVTPESVKSIKIKKNIK